MEKSQHSWYSSHEKRETDADPIPISYSRRISRSKTRLPPRKVASNGDTHLLRGEASLGRDLDRSIKITCPRQGNRIINREADDQMEYPSAKKTVMKLLLHNVEKRGWVSTLLVRTFSQI